MKKFCLVLLSALLVFSMASQARAEQSTASATGSSYLDNQVYTMAYNNSGSDITSHSVVILDTSGTAGSTLGAYITTTTTADHWAVAGVTVDPNCVAGTPCRVCIRGPIEVLFTSATHVTGTIAATSTTAGEATTYSTADGTVGGHLGKIIGSSDLGGFYAWVWVEPKIHK